MGQLTQTVWRKKQPELQTKQNSYGTCIPPFSCKAQMFIPQNKKKANMLYFTDKNFSGVMKVKLSQIANENVDKTQS